MDPTRTARLEQFKDQLLGGPIHSGAMTRTVLELALLIAASDGDVSELEAEQIVDIVHRLTPGPFDLSTLRSELALSRERLAVEGVEARIHAAGVQVLDPEARRQAYRIVAAVALVDRWLDRNELRFFHQLARAFEISPEESQGMVTEIRRKLFPDDEQV